MNVLLLFFFFFFFFFFLNWTLKSPNSHYWTLQMRFWCHLSGSNPLDSSLRRFSCKSSTGEGKPHRVQRENKELIKEQEARRESGVFVDDEENHQTEKQKRRSIPKHGGGKGHRRNCRSFAEGPLTFAGRRPTIRLLALTLAVHKLWSITASLMEQLLISSGFVFSASRQGRRSWRGS